MSSGRAEPISVIRQAVGDWSVSAVVFAEERCRIALPVRGIIGNSITTSLRGKEVALRWRRAVAVAAKHARNGRCLDPCWIYAVSAGFSFHPPSHGNQWLDVENFIKPAFDALAAGLFCEESVDCQLLERFGYDDTGFRYLFVHRLQDAKTAAEEGVGFVVSVLQGERGASL